MSKMGLHDPFENLKHKLWPKEGLKIKLAIWFSTIKHQEWIWFPCVQVVCNILLKRNWQGLQLCFKPHLNRKSTHKVMGPKVARVPTLAILGLGVSGKNAIGWGLVEKHKVYCKGEGCNFPQVRAMMSLLNSNCLWLVITPKVLQLCTNHLVFGLC